jgi:hypothetical protein
VTPPARRFEDVGGFVVPDCVANADVDCSGTLVAEDILDILLFVAHLPPLPASSDCPAIGT